MVSKIPTVLEAIEAAIEGFANSLSWLSPPTAQCAMGNAIA